MSKEAQKAVFDYPAVFVSLPDYTAHAGQVVEVIRPCTEDEAHPPCEDMEGMFIIRAADGWTGQAFESELLPIA